MMKQRYSTPLCTFLVFALIPLSTSIISPPDEIVEQFAEEFKKWKIVREEFESAMDHPMGLPHFNCSRTVSFSPPESVHQLHPSNIEVIAALGDSVSVAQAAKSDSVLNLLQKYPGVAFVTGDSVSMEQQATLYNMFKNFSPTLKGGSSNHVDRFYDFNFAVPGAFSSELPEQAKRLAESLHHKLNDENLKKWKFVNIFIGHNDLCQICQNQTLHGPEAFGNALRFTLSIIQTSIPNVFVNIMPPINVQIHSQAHNVSRFCELSHRKTCPCIFDYDKLQYKTIKEQFDEQLNSVVEEFQSNSTNFTVVIAPAMDLESIPLLQDKPNVALLALDCFHLSPIAHDIAAKQIWKGLFERIGQKTVTNQLAVGFDKFVCPPVECPYLRTSLNSESCEPATEFKILQLPPSGDLQNYGGSIGGSGISFVMIIGFMMIGTTLVLLFVRASFRRPTDDFSAERRHLIPPKRADLNDYIF